MNKSNLATILAVMALGFSHKGSSAKKRRKKRLDHLPGASQLTGTDALGSSPAMPPSPKPTAAPAAYSAQGGVLQRAARNLRGYKKWGT